MIPMDDPHARKGPLPDERATVFVVEDDLDVSKVLCGLLESAGYDVQAFTTGGEFLQRYAPQPLACALIDLRLPGISGIELQRRLAQHDVPPPVILMTGYASAATAVEAMKLGAVDYIEKPIVPAELFENVRTALERDRNAKRHHSEQTAVADMMARLTPRERQVLELVVAGHPSKDIAEILSLAKKTVDLHRSHIMSKLQAQSVVDVVTMALTGHRTRRAQAV